MGRSVGERGRRLVVVISGPDAVFSLRNSKPDESPAVPAQPVVIPWVSFEPPVLGVVSGTSERVGDRNRR